MLFDGAQAELPTATLRPSASQARHRVIAGDLHRWLAGRWSWLRPRTVPLLAAFAGMVAILGATKYLSTFAARGRGMLPASVEASKLPTYGFALTAPDMPGAERHYQARPGSDANVSPALSTSPLDYRCGLWARVHR